MRVATVPMALHATESVGDAFEATRALLLPFDAPTWLRLTLVSLFVGGVGGFATPFQDGGPVPAAVEIPPIGGVGDPGPVLVALGLLVLLVAAALVFVGSVMEFVLVEALATEAVEVRAPFREHFRQGLGLFAFRVALLVAGLFVVVLPILAIVHGLLAPAVGFALSLVLVVPFVLVAVMVLGVVHGFTTVFVVPVMIMADCGVVAGWRRFLPGLRERAEEYLVYLVLSVILAWLGGAAISLVVGVVALFVFVPLGVLGVFAFLGGGPLSLLVVAPVLLVGLAVVYAAASVPVLVYLRYYALLELGDTSGYDLIVARRAEIRGE